MWRIILLLLGFYIGGSALAAGAVACGAGGADSAVFRRLVVAYFEGVAKKDFRQMVAVTTPDFVLYEFGKKWNNDSAFRNIQYHEPFSVVYTLTNFVAFMDARSGDATYHTQANFVFGDGAARLDFVESASFRKTSAGWKINMIQVSSVDDPAVNMPADYRKYDTVRFIPAHYRERLAVFAGEQPSSGGVVFLGDSHIEFGDWKRLLGDPKAVNRGIAGDNTFGMLDRLGEVIALRPSRIFIEAGVNDLGQGVPAALIAANIGTMAAYLRVKVPSSRVYVVSVLPTNEHARTDYPEIAGKNAAIREVDSLLAGQAGSRGYTYLDLARLVVEGSGELDERYARPDGVHLNEAGYGVWVGMIRAVGQD